MTREWTIKTLLEWTSGYFNSKGIMEPRLEAELLLAHVLGLNRVDLYVNYHQPVNSRERTVYREIILRRLQGEPVAYLTGRKEFYSLNFKVNRNVLIPRPDTEILVEKAIEQGKSVGPLVRIADIGTGSGAIAITLAFNLPEAEVYAIDISPAALRVAEDNARLHGVVDRISFLPGDLAVPLLENGVTLDMIVANLPYIPTSEIERLDPEIKDFEPHRALDGGEDGLTHYRRLIPQAYRVLRTGGYFLAEIGYDQAPLMKALMTSFTGVEIIPDLAGRDRLVMGRKGK